MSSYVSLAFADATVHFYRRVDFGLFMSWEDDIFTKASFLYSCPFMLLLMLLFEAFSLTNVFFERKQVEKGVSDLGGSLCWIYFCHIFSFCLDKLFTKIAQDYVKDRVAEEESKSKTSLFSTNFILTTVLSRCSLACSVQQACCVWWLVGCVE